jgi:hypothetical protein
MCCNILWHAEDVKLLGGPGVKDEKVRYGHGYRNDYPGYGGANVGTTAGMGTVVDTEDMRVVLGVTLAMDLEEVVLVTLVVDLEDEVVVTTRWMQLELKWRWQCICLLNCYDESNAQCIITYAQCGCNISCIIT